MKYLRRSWIPPFRNRRWPKFRQVDAVTWSIASSSRRGFKTETRTAGSFFGT